MYLHDYQLTTLRKFKRGYNHFLHGPRQSGVTTIMLNYGLHYCSQDNGATVHYYTTNMEYVRTNVFNIIYAAQTSRVAAFDLILSSEHDNVFSFGNGSKLHITTVDHAKINPPCDLLLIDDTVPIPLDTLEFIIDRSDAIQFILGATGGIHINSGIHTIYMKSLKGLYDMDYIRLDWRVISSIVSQYDKILSQIGADAWNVDAEYLIKLHPPL